MSLDSKYKPFLPYGEWLLSIHTERAQFMEQLKIWAKVRQRIRSHFYIISFLTLQQLWFPEFSFLGLQVRKLMSYYQNCNCPERYRLGPAILMKHSPGVPFSQEIVLLHHNYLLLVTLQSPWIFLLFISIFLLIILIVYSFQSIGRLI